MTKELNKDSLGLMQSIAMGVAGSAPSFSISATMATLIGAVGVLAPASLFYCGILMLGIVFAYVNLNAYDPNAGASYAWVRAIIGKTPGFFAGWALLAASVIFMVSATLPAGSATLMLVAPDLVESQFAVTACAVLWLMLVTFVVVKGIGLTGKVQSFMTCCEICILLGLSVTALIKAGPQAIHALSLRDFLPTAFTPSSFANGAVIALFFFWGWDVSLNLTEETQNSAKVPGLGAVGAIFLVMAAFAGFSAIALLSLADDEISQSGTNILFAVANKIVPAPWSYLAVLALMLSTIGTLETQMLQFSRTMFAQSRDGTLHARWSSLHDDWKTPHMATFLIAALGAFLLLASLSSKSVAEVMAQSINVIGVQAAYYYGLAGFACSWHFRSNLQKSFAGAVGKVIWPALSGLLFWWAGGMTMLDFDRTTLIIAIGSMAFGVIPLLRYQVQT